MRDSIKRMFKNTRTFIEKRFKLIIIFILIVAATIGVYSYFKNKKSSASSTYVEYKVQKRNIDVTVSGTGTISSSTKQTISSNNAGTITKAYFKEGDKVKQGDLLFQLDDSSAASQVKRTKLSIEQSQRDLDDAYQSIKNLFVTASLNGQVSGITVNEGDSVNKGQEICAVTDNLHLKLTVPFNANQVKNFYVGEPATVFLQDYMDTVSGEVVYISSSGKVISGGGTTYDVEISFDNPGAITSGTKANAQIAGVSSIDSGTVAYQKSSKIRAEVSGTVQKVNIRDGQQVANGQEIITLVNDDLNTQVLSYQIKLQDYYEQLESQIKTQNDYKLYALFDGTIVSQETKTGDVVKANAELAVISNPDAMEFSIAVDELDIAKIKLGMTANITIDALADKKFTGVVSKVSQIGTSSNGVTTYDVTIVINNPQEIKEGMNANADILIEHKENVLALPIAAVQKNQNRSFVYLKSSTNAPGTGSAGQQSQSDNSSKWQRGNSNNSSSNNNSSNNNRSSNKSSNSSSQSNMTKTLGTMRPIETGIYNDEYIEITGGLSEGDIVVSVAKTSTTTAVQGGFGMPGGGMRMDDMGGMRQNSSNRNSSGSSQGGGSKSGN